VSCDGLIDGLTSIAENRRPGYVSMRADIERQLADTVRSLDGGRRSGFSSDSGFDSDNRSEASSTNLNSADGDPPITIYRVPWDLVLTSVLAGGLTVLLERFWRIGAGAAVVIRSALT
jgi:hypothetical protein